MFDLQVFLNDYAIFFAETLTFVVLIGGAILLIIAAASDKEPAEKLEIKKLNERFEAYESTLNEQILDKESLKEVQKRKKKEIKLQEKSAHSKNDGGRRKRIFVIDFDGDIKASAASSLAEEVTAVLTVATEHDEVFVKLYSAGGLVHAYGLAASQLQRIRKRNIPLVAAVDKVAASGGYMMACVANRILAAPFAIVGSIGVVAQIPNFHRLLQKHDVDFELHTAGQYKRTLTVFGENTDAAREKFRLDLEETHKLFQNFIAEHRPIVDLNSVATGEYWHGTQAIDLKLIDDLCTSDDYLMQHAKDCDIYQVTYTTRPKLAERLTSFMRHSLERIYGLIKQDAHEKNLV